MKRTIFVLILIGALAPLGFAQDLDHGEVGAFADYFHAAQTNTNLVGVGGRLALKPTRYFGLEAEMNYDFDQDFNEGFTNTSTGTVIINRSDYRILNGLFGPTVSTGHGPLRFFLTAKGGFIDFQLSNAPATLGTFTSRVSNLRADHVNGAFYPGGGVEAHVGPMGLRLDVGDEMYFNNGTHHDLRVTFGPTIRF
jgi:hypothetical protein